METTVQGLIQFLKTTAIRAIHHDVAGETILEAGICVKTVLHFSFLFNIVTHFHFYLICHFFFTCTYDESLFV